MPGVALPTQPDATFDAKLMLFHCLRRRFLWFEAAAGTVVAKIAANDQLVVMYRPAATAAAQ
jgi:hypothetical protein